MLGYILWHIAQHFYGVVLFKLQQFNVLATNIRNSEIKPAQTQKNSASVSAVWSLPQGTALNFLTRSFNIILKEQGEAAI